MHFWADYSLFFTKTLTTIIAILIVFGGILALLRKGKSADKSKLEIKKLNEKYDNYADTLNSEMLSKAEHKKLLRQEKKNNKAKDGQAKKRVFVLNFHGDIRASAVNSLREEITALLRVAKSTDEIVVCLESPGGMVSPYGLAASQLQRIKQKHIPLTVIVDKVAASGGYLMACVADRILAAPFAIIGSIGVVAQLPNFHRFLKKRDIDFELLTAGKYKRTLTLFGENTDEARQKFKEEMEEIHSLFQNFIAQYRPQLNLDLIATGEHWPAAQALAFKLIDGLDTSDDYLLNASQNADVYEIKYTTKKSLSEKLTGSFSKLNTIINF